MVRCVIFDMDGTLTRPYIDWRRLRRDLGVPDGMTIMEYISSLGGRDRERALSILEDREYEAALNSELNEGLLELLGHLRGLGIKLVVVTNNSRRSAERILEKHGLSFDLVLTREDGQVKPSGHLISKALELTGVRGDEAVVIGDGRYDLEAAGRAGVRAILLKHGGMDIEHRYSVSSLREVPDLIRGL